MIEKTRTTMHGITVLKWVEFGIHNAVAVTGVKNMDRLNRVAEDLRSEGYAVETGHWTGDSTCWLTAQRFELAVQS